MRLIDADELKRLGYVLTRTYPKDPQTMVYETKNIEDIPTIDPVKHGRWKYEKRNCGVRTSVFALFCSECDAMSVVANNYCPNCGAKMDGDMK